LISICADVSRLPQGVIPGGVGGYVDEGGAVPTMRDSLVTLDANKALETLKELLKEGGWIKAAIALACGFFLLFARWRWVPPLDAWIVQATTFGLLLFGFLALASFIRAAHRFFPIDKWVVHYLSLHRARREVERYIPYMTQAEREIVAYLLAKNQKTFCADMDGGRASTLLSRGIVVIAYQPGQQFDQQNVTMIVPDHLWAILERHKDKFPYTGTDEDEDESHPWREGWMNRI
jgi:hypothetical protein